MKNDSHFSAIRALNLPIDQYAITGSGALGIRNLRTIGDIDIIVTDKMWTELETQYGAVESNGVIKIAIPGSCIEAFRQGSFGAKEDRDDPTVVQRIQKAEIIENLPFESLEHVLYYKRKMNREKDQADIKMIEELIGL